MQSAGFVLSLVVTIKQIDYHCQGSCTSGRCALVSDESFKSVHVSTISSHRSWADLSGTCTQTWTTHRPHIYNIRWPHWTTHRPHIYNVQWPHTFTPHNENIHGRHQWQSIRKHLDVAILQLTVLCELLYNTWMSLLVQKALLSCRNWFLSRVSVLLI